MFHVPDAAQLAAGLDELLAQWTDTVVPASLDPQLVTRYAPGYAWMWGYEKALKARFREAGARLRSADERVLFGPDGAFSEGLSNAFLHGHKRDRSLAIVVRVEIASRSMRLTISDQGPGFDHAAAVAKAGTGAHRFQVAGNGLRSIATNDRIAAAYRDGGRTLVLVFNFA